MTTQPTQHATEICQFANLTDGQAEEICRIVKLGINVPWTIIAIQHQPGVHTFYGSIRHGDSFKRCSGAQRRSLRSAITWMVKGVHVGGRNL